MPTLIETKVGEHRGVNRIYLEGVRLSREGFLPGMTYQRQVKSDEGKIILRLVDSGDYVVSRKVVRNTEQPVLDIRMDELASVAGDSGRLRILIANKCIIILRHFNDERIAERTERLIREIDGGTLATASLFHGGGVTSKALHAGLESVGLKSKIALAVEIESPYVESSLKNNPELWSRDSIVVNAGVEGLKYHAAGMPKASILEAGLPCLGASNAGKSKLGLTHAEDHPTVGAAFFYTLQAVDALNPAIILFENVKSYATSASASIIRSVLANLGYSMQEKVLNGNDFGALEARERWFMLAVSSGLEEFINLESVDLFHSKPPVNVGEILDKEIDETAWSELTYLREKEKRDISAGKGFRMQILDETSCVVPTIVRNYAKVQSTGALLRKEDGSNLLRLFTPAEHARIKTVPESVIEGISSTQAHQQLGQGVIYNCVLAIAKVVGHGLNSYRSCSQSSVA